jgi:hypothetical protein
MVEHARRKDLKAAYRDATPDAGVYRIVNTGNSKSLVGRSTNLASISNRFQFARSTATASALDQRLAVDVAQFGFDALEFEVLDRLDVTPGMTRPEILQELLTMEGLWREKLGSASLY